MSEIDDLIRTVPESENMPYHGKNRYRGAPRKTHCLRGHEFTSENTYLRKRLVRGKTYLKRVCKMCASANNKKYARPPVPSTRCEACVFAMHRSWKFCPRCGVKQNREFRA